MRIIFAICSVLLMTLVSCGKSELQDGKYSASGKGSWIRTIEIDGDKAIIDGTEYSCAKSEKKFQVTDSSNGVIEFEVLNDHTIRNAQFGTFLISNKASAENNESHIANGLQAAVSGNVEGAAKSISTGFGNAVKNASEGIDKSLLQVKLVPMLDVLSAGITVTRGDRVDKKDSAGVKMYLLFHKNFTGKLLLCVIDKSGNEVGRNTVNVTGKEDESKFVESYFDPNVSLFLASHVEISVKP